MPIHTAFKALSRLIRPQRHFAIWTGFCRFPFDPENQMQAIINPCLAVLQGCPAFFSEPFDRLNGSSFPYKHHQLGFKFLWNCVNARYFALIHIQSSL
jgi:hypothetical protein